MTQTSLPMSPITPPTLAAILQVIAEQVGYIAAEVIAQLLQAQLSDINPDAAYHPFTPAGKTHVIAWKLERHGE